MKYETVVRRSDAMLHANNYHEFNGCANCKHVDNDSEGGSECGLTRITTDEWDVSARVWGNGICNKYESAH